MGDQHLVERGEARPLLLRLVERNERARGAAVVGMRGEDPLVRAERAIGRLQLLLVDPCGAEREVDLDGGIRGAIRRARELLDEALPVARLRVERGETVEVVEGEMTLAQDAERLRVPRGELEDAAPDAERAVVVLEAVGEHAPELLENGQLRRGVFGELGTTLERVRDGDEILVAVGLLFEGVERDCVGRVLVEREPVKACGVGAAVEALGGHLGHLHPERAPLGARGVLRLVVVEIVELSVCAALPVELLELLDRLAVRRVHFAELLVGFDGVLHVGELLEPSLGDGAIERHLRLRVRLQLGEPHLRGEEIAPAAERLVHARELAHRVSVLTIETDDLREHGDECGVALDVLAVNLGDLAEDRQPSRRVVRSHTLEIRAEEIREVVELSRGAVETLQRVASSGVRGLGAEQRAPLLDRLLRVRAVLGEAGDLRRDLAALRSLGHRPLRVAQDLDEASRLAALGAPLAEEPEHAGMRGLRLAQTLEVRLRRLGLVPHPPVDHRDLEDDADLLALAHAAAFELPFVERDEVVPHLVVGEVVDQCARRLCMTR